MKKLKKANVRKGVAKIRREDGLQRPADSPKIGDFEPAFASRQQGDHDGDHGPIAQLKRQVFLPRYLLRRP